MSTLVLLLALAICFAWSCLLSVILQWAPRAEYWDLTLAIFATVVASRFLFGERK